MNRIERMVAEMCPDGVEYRPLGEVGVFIRGNGIQKSDFVDEGVAAVHYGQIHTRFGISTDHAVSKVPAEMARRLRHVEYGDLLIATTSEDDDAVGKATAWLGLDDCVIGGDAYIYRHSLDPKYVSHFFASVEFQTRKKKYLTGTKVRRISDASLSRILIPVPPIEIQREVVGILDSFTKLEAELEAELEARKAQYVEVRQFMLSELGSQLFLVEDLVKLIRIPRGLPRSDYREFGAFPIVDQGRGMIAAWTDRSDSLVLAENYVAFGDHTREIKFIDFDFVPGADGLRLFRAVEGVDSRYLFHALSSLNIPSRGYNRHWSLLAKMRVPLPVLAEQHRIADVLDDFDALVNDLSSGLPAEIAARRQQYEYYRDRLLTFPEKK